MPPNVEGMQAPLGAGYTACNNQSVCASSTLVSVVALTVEGAEYWSAAANSKAAVEKENRQSEIL